MKKIILLFLLLSTICQSQIVKRIPITDSVRGIDFTRRYKSSIIEFKSPLDDGDYISVGILSDSLDSTFMTLNLFVYYPPQINPDKSTIILIYEDNSKDVLVPLNKPTEKNYVEYDFLINTFSIQKKEAKQIQFKGIQTYKIEERNFFKEFMKEILPNDKKD